LNNLHVNLLNYLLQNFSLLLNDNQKKIQNKKNVIKKKQLKPVLNQSKIKNNIALTKSRINNTGVNNSKIIIIENNNNNSNIKNQFYIKQNNKNIFRKKVSKLGSIKI